jgi:hypothetical protein
METSHSWIAVDPDSERFLMGSAKVQSCLSSRLQDPFYHPRQNFSRKSEPTISLALVTLLPLPRSEIAQRDRAFLHLRARAHAQSRLPVQSMPKGLEGDQFPKK